MSKRKGWKDFLLSSGIPLEYSVRTVFESLGISRPSEFSYKRRNELGQDITFSVDTHATKILDRNIWLEFLVECKYRHENVSWIFTPSEYGCVFGPEFRDLFVILDDYNENLKIDSDKINKFSDLYDLCGKGIEILPSSANPKAIQEGVYQLKHCVVHKIVDCLKHQINSWLGKEEQCFILIPILVTTAELWRIKQGTTLETIRKCKDIEEICEKRDIVLLYEEPNDDLKRYTFEHLSSNLTSEEKSALDRKVKPSWSEHGFFHYATHLAKNFPSIFLVVNHVRFQKAMKNCISFFGTADILK